MRIYNSIYVVVLMMTVEKERHISELCAIRGIPCSCLRYAVSLIPDKKTIYPQWHRYRLCPFGLFSCNMDFHVGPNKKGYVRERLVKSGLFFYATV